MSKLKKLTVSRSSLEVRRAALEFILRGLLLDCCLICYFSSAVARDASSPLCEGCFFYSLTTGFVDKLSEAEKAEEALGDKEGYDAIAPQKDNIGKKINGWNVELRQRGRRF